MSVRNRFFCFVLALLMAPLSHAAGSDSAFYLKNGDTVVFYGDSITEQDLYDQWIEQYVVTRFPRMRVHFYGAGVGGDRVTGGIGGAIDTRLARDVFSHKPSVVTVMLGMNDGRYTQETDAIVSTYVHGYEHLLESLHAHLPGVRVTVLGPSAYDDVTRPDSIPGGYNSVLIHFAALDKELARKYGDSFVNLNPPVVGVLERAEALDPLVARLLIPGRVHPDTIAHWAMAEAVLENWNAPKLVSSVTIDAAEDRLADAQNATVDHVERREKEGLSWTETENALPLPIDTGDATMALLLKLTDLQKRLNQEPLRVVGLQAGQYRLSIDTKTIGTFGADDLAKGVNLADYGTPMRAQARIVGWLIRNRDQVQGVSLGIPFAKTNTVPLTEEEHFLSEYEDSIEDAIYAAAIPKSHVFSLAHVEGASN